MTSRPIMDAGPGLNFFAANCERLLFDTLGPLAIPETVKFEVLRKSKQSRFAPAARVIPKLSPKFLEVISDDETEDLARAVYRICGAPFADRKLASRDLGETMVIAHAAVAAETGIDVIVLIDDRDGRAHATREAQRLDRLRKSDPQVGSIKLIGTLTVLGAQPAGSFSLTEAH